MNSLPENFATNQQRLEEAKTERYRALQKIRTLCETGRRSLVVPFLMVNLQRNPALKKNTTLAIGCDHVRRFQIHCGEDHTTDEGNHRRPEHRQGRVCGFGMALADKDATVRMTTWLYQLLEREKLTKFDLPEGFPLAMLYSTEPATAEQSN